MSRRHQLPFAALIVAAVLLLFANPNELLPAGQAAPAALTFLCMACWATDILPAHLTSMLFFTLAMLLGVAPAQVVFSGFASTAWWLVFGGLVVGVAINSTGLGRRVARRIALHLDGSYARLILGLVAVGLLFAFLMPSAMGRVVLLVPIALAIAGHFGFRAGSNGRHGVLLAVILGSFTPAFAILPANVPNMVLAGLSDTQYHLSPLYGEYLLLHFPVLGLLKSVLIAGLILLLFPDRPSRETGDELASCEAMSRGERLLALILVVLLALWMTDFLHHISPAWVALAGALLVLLPGVEIVPPALFNEKINYSSLFFIAGILGVGGVVSNSGLGATLAEKLLRVLPLGPDRGFLNFVSLSLASTLTGLATTQPGVPAVITPLAGELSQVTGLSLKAVLMTQVTGFATFIFPYQAPPVIVGMQLAGVGLWPTLKLCLLLAGASILLLLPLDYLWWKLLGWL